MILAVVIFGTLCSGKMRIIVVAAAFPRTGPEQMTHWFKLATVGL